jgi:hypothetical protein
LVQAFSLPKLITAQNLDAAPVERRRLLFADIVERGLLSRLVQPSRFGGC